MRKHEISCTIVIRALSQLKTMYKDDWEVIVGNCDTLLFLGGSDATTLDYISKKLGKETIRAKNTSRNYGRSGGSGVSFNTTGRELMQPDEISAMDNMNCIVFIRGEAPFFSVKYDYPKHPNYHLTGDADDNKLFDVRKEVHTVPAKPKITKEKQELEQIKYNAQETANEIVRARQTCQQLKNEKKKGQARRNAVIKQKEQELAGSVDTNAETLDEFLRLNDFDITAQDIESGISARYKVESIYNIPDDYMDDDEFTSGLLDDR